MMYSCYDKKYVVESELTYVERWRFRLEFSAENIIHSMPYPSPLGIGGECEVVGFHMAKT